MRPLTLAFLLTLPVLAHAQQTTPDRRVYTAFTAGEVAVVLQQLDLRFERLTDATGDPLLQINLGPGVAMLFYECERRRCGSLALYTALPDRYASLADVNAWNQAVRFTRAYLDDEGVPVLEADLDLAGGVTRGALAEFIRTYLGSLADFLSYLSSEG